MEHEYTPCEVAADSYGDMYLLDFGGIVFGIISVFTGFMSTRTCCLVIILSVSLASLQIWCCLGINSALLLLFLYGL